MDAGEVAIIVAGISFVTSAIPLIMQWRKDKRKAPLEDAGEAVNTSKSAAEALRSYSDEIVRLRDKMKSLEERVSVLEEENAAKDALIDIWRIGIRRLIAQLVSANMTPVWQPDENDGK